MKIASIKAALAKVENKKDGFTVPLTDEKPKRYIVARTDNAGSVSVLALRREALALASQGYAPTLGGWEDAKTGIFYLDVGTSFESYFVAERKAKEWGQKAFWDNSAKVEVRV